jgi:hypothetical protein
MSKLKAPTTRCIIGVPCPDHGFYHGAEAEELREKLEGLIGEFDNDGDSEEEAAGRFVARALQRVLDEVDARDSLAYLEVQGNEEDEEEYYILSLNGSQGAYCQRLLWWRPDNKGYTACLEAAGRYKKSTIKEALGYYNNGDTTLALSCEDVERRAHLMVDVDEKYELMKLATFEVTPR